MNRENGKLNMKRYKMEQCRKSSLHRRFSCTLLFLLSILPLHSIIIPPSGMTCMAQEAQTVRPVSGWIGGRYYISRKVNVPGATVKLGAEGGGKIYITATDENGRWDLKEMPEGRYSIEMFKEGFVPIRKNDLVVQVPFKSVVELRATPSKKSYGSIASWTPAGEGQSGAAGTTGASSRAMRIQGRAMLKGGDPLADAEIILKDMMGDRNPYRARSDSDGNFFLENVPAGVYDTSVYAIAYFTLRLRLDLKTDLGMRVIMVQQPQNYQYSPSELIPPEEPLPPSI